ncbi:hypothetical protein HDU92_004316 [Lobulomyces angularis]|nr:hypothetical protein HDU92_004316 [Lobulomyces angularis]
MLVKFIYQIFCLSVSLNFGQVIADYQSEHKILLNDASVKIFPRQNLSCQIETSPNPSFWISQVSHNGISAFHLNPSSYKVYRNVRDYGARGDGITDDTAAINAAIKDQNRCGENCGSSTILPALVYFPAGTYIVSSPIIMYYYTQLVGEYHNRPILKAAPSFSGMAIIDSNVYIPGGNGAQWYINQNNFFRQVRNFVFDTTATPITATTTCIHWQVAQATSLTYLAFKMSTDPATGHQGIWMENGSGGFMSELVFNGGKFAMWMGNQQFTVRDVQISNAQTGIYLNWGWQWSFQKLTISNSKIGIDMTSGGSSGQQVASLTVLDSDFNSVEKAILTVKSSTSLYAGAGTLILDNVKVSNVAVIVQGESAPILKGSASSTVSAWSIGRDVNGAYTEGTYTSPRSQLLLDSQGNFFTRSRPQYNNYEKSQFINVKDFGVRGDGKTDDSKLINELLTTYAHCKILFFPMGSYVIKSTVFVPVGSRIVGETWSLIQPTGLFFSDPSNPQPAFKIGNSGDTGLIELSDLMFSPLGQTAGAILVEWNVGQSSQGSAAMWDCHFRVGGSIDSQMNSKNCPKGGPVECFGAFMLLHLTKKSSAYLENIWGWTADHDLDVFAQTQIDIYSGRGILIESENGPVWLYGTSSEHNALYQYQIVNAKNVFMSVIQSESPYWQASSGLHPIIKPVERPDDPILGANQALGLRIVNSSNIFVYGLGLYSFFDRYEQVCLKSSNCQKLLAVVEKSQKVSFISINTIGSSYMMQIDGKDTAGFETNTAAFSSVVSKFIIN